MNSYLSKIKESAIPIIESHNLVFDSIEESFEYGINTIRVFVDNPITLSCDIDIIEDITKELLDKVNDDIPDDYFLEVSSLGIERVFKSFDELNKAIDEYIYLELNNMYLDYKTNSFYGYLRKVNDDQIDLEINIKGRKKTITCLKENIKFIRKAIKF